MIIDRYGYTDESDSSTPAERFNSAQFIEVDREERAWLDACRSQIAQEKRWTDGGAIWLSA